MKETQLVRQILDYCRYQDLLFTRTQAGAIQTAPNNLGRSHFMRFGRPGWPDITGGVNGRLIGVECKIGKNKQSKLQADMETFFKFNGCEYWTIYSLDDFIERLRVFKKTLTT